MKQRVSDMEPGTIFLFPYAYYDLGCADFFMVQKLDEGELYGMPTRYHKPIRIDPEYEYEVVQ